MACAVSRKDSLVVLATGGGKSLCFQASALTLPGMAIVVSPLISLMKDQVNALRECGVPAARVDSSQSPGERRAVREQIRDGKIKLLYLSPERLLKPPKKGARKPKGAKKGTKKGRKKRRKAVVAVEAWEGVDEALFERLRGLRKDISTRKRVPAYAVFTDAALRDMARRRPATRDEFLEVSGVGETKCRQYAKICLEAIKAYADGGSS